MSVPGYRKFCFRSARNRANNALNPNPDDIEEVSITDQSKRRKRNSTDISQGPSALNATDISRHLPKKICNILEPDTAIVSTISQEEVQGDGAQPGLTNIVKLALSLGTIEQLMERLEDAESHAKATETKIFEAKLVESNVKVKDETVESIFDTILSSIQQLRVDGYQAHSRVRRSQVNFKAWRSKVKEEAINLVLQEKHEEQEASRRSIERCKHKMKLLVDERERRERQVAVLRWCLVIRQLFNDLEKGVFGREVEFLLNT